jgi:hypothetical protein
MDSGFRQNDDEELHLVAWLGPVNTNRISIDGAHFFTGQGALSAVYLLYTSKSATPDGLI